MITIFEYGLDLVEAQTFVTSAGAEILKIDVQVGVAGRKHLVVWVRVDTRARDVRRHIRMVGIGTDAGGTGRYLDTVQSGTFVWHFFDQGES